MEHTNLTDNEVIFFSLVKKGYGTLKEVEAMDTPKLLKILEYESIVNDIESLAIEDAKGEY